MKDLTPKIIELKNYKKPDYLIPTIDLSFDLHDEETLVSSRMQVKRNHHTHQNSHDGSATNLPQPLVLNGEQLLLKEIKLNGVELNSSQYELTADLLTIPNVPEEFQLEILGQMNPAANFALEGLYKSGDVFCTQNEPEGFRRITYFVDRSDVMSKYTTKITADKQKYPVLLSNGNEVAKGDLPEGRHWVSWEDPFPKPCYLFALVAGDLGMIKDYFVTKSNRKIELRLYCDKGNEDKCDHAMESLKKAMKWDEEVYNLEYDLDIYMIVAVDAFNMGAMENKGLNIFNTSCVLSNPTTATDADFHRVEGVVAHEYFHNWTGNRVTCRDWFQLTLKEGLTVFRDQEFSADMTSRNVQRIKDVRSLRIGQFPEDAGPTAHPIRPESYIEVNNFYTHTVYNKGSEVIRMVYTLIGKDMFRKGMDEYFRLFDGQAVTTEDFLYSMEKVSKMDLTQFKLWYSQAGTPEVEVNSSYDQNKQTLTLKIRQSCPETPGQKDKRPFLIPLTVGLIDSQGKDLPLQLLQLKGSEAVKSGATSTVLKLTQEEQEFVFAGVPENVLPSINRNFSAPIKLKMTYSLEELMFFLSHDQDPFNRWEAGQQLATRLFHDLLRDYQEGRPLKLHEGFVKAFGKLLEDESVDPAFKAVSLILPDESIFIEDFSPIPFEGITKVREFMVKELSMKHQATFLKLYHRYQGKNGYLRDQKSIGERDLKNVCLSYLMKNESEESLEICFEQWQKASNMTDEISALRELAHTSREGWQREKALKGFYEKWKHDLLVITKWFSVQSTAKRPDALEKVKALMQDPAFNIQIPNFVKSLLLAFTQNHVCFHDSEGKGYEFLADKILQLDKINPLVASSLATGFNKFAKLDPVRKKKMKVQLERVLISPNLSNNVYEIIFKNLQLEKK